jgi:N,N'-diacetyllegionaminate synthase|tara:strand:+ start:115 stop:1119 length:1005 start_codon:yes stop_codon:yes gene_type:complete
MKTLIIAEAGVNHNGSIKLALKLAKEAKKCGADIVKFQTFVPDQVVVPKARKAKYQKTNKRDSETQLNMIKKFQLSFDDYTKIKNECKKNKIIFMSSAFDEESIIFLYKLKQSTYKIPSGEITNFPALRTIAKFKKKVILSTGMSNYKEIEKALNILIKFGTKKKDITILHCNTSYPTPMKDVNLLAIKEIKKKFKVNVGYSDHTMGIEIPIAAVTMGATVIEKHLTLDKNFKGPDHKASLEPKVFKKMVQSIRNIERALGKKEKKITSSEKPNILICRKSIVAKKNIAKGDFFSEANLTTKRPGTGQSPMNWLHLIGKKSKRNYKKDGFIKDK